MAELYFFDDPETSPDLLKLSEFASCFLVLQWFLKSRFFWLLYGQALQWKVTTPSGPISSYVTFIVVSSSSMNRKIVRKSQDIFNFLLFLPSELMAGELTLTDSEWRDIDRDCWVIDTETTTWIMQLSLLKLLITHHHPGTTVACALDSTVQRQVSSAARILEATCIPE